MAYRQRNIPVATKEESESQTDVRLLENYLLDARNQEEQRRTSQTTIKLSEVYSSSGLLRPFGDHHLLKEFSKGLQQLRELPYDDKLFGKRLQLLESQINGLLKRDFLIHSSAEGSQSWSSYYSTLNEKEKEVIRLQREKIYSDLKVVHLEERIKALEQQVQQLRTSLVHSQQALEENKMYSEFFIKIKTIIETSERKGTDIQTAFNEQVLPTYTQFNYNLNALTRIINKEVSINIRPLTLSLARELDKTLREPNFNEDKLNDNVQSLMNNFRALRGVEYLKSQFENAQRTEMAENNYRNMISLLIHEMEELKQTEPHLKEIERFDWLLRKLQDERVDLVAINGWMNLATSEVRVRQIRAEDKQLRVLLGSLAGEFKRVYARFPELQKHCSSAFLQIMNSEVLLQLIEGGSIERLKEIIVHEVETVKVDNVYNYQNTKDAKLIFHLRVLIKTLLEELYKIKEKHSIDLSLDEAILALLKEQCIEGINVEEVIGLFRPPARYIEVPIVIENKVYESNVYEKSVPINKSKPVVISEEKLQVVTVNKEVPVYIENPVDHVIQSQVPVQIVTEKIVETPVEKEVIIDRVVEQIKEVPTILEKVVPAYEREEVVKEIEVDKVIKDIEIREMQKIVEVKVQEIREVEKIVEKAVIANEFKELIKEVEVRVPQVITKTEILEVEKKIPYIIEKQVPVEVRSEIAVEIKVPEIQFIQLVEYRDKPIIKTNTVQKLQPVELKVQKEIIKEVPKEIFIDRSHFIKGDKEEVIRQVEVFIDKPIIQEVLKTKELEVEKIVPLYITEQVPIVQRIPQPYFSEKVKEVEVENVKVVTAKQEIVKPIEIDKPVPIIVQKEIVKVQPQFIDRIIEKIVEVPRVVQVQKIVEKIVVVPRIVQKIVEVPKIIEKIVICKETELQIVEVPVPQIIIQEVEIPIEVPVEKTVIVREKEIQKVEVPTIVEKKTIEQKLVEVQVEKQVPVQVIREVPVQTYRDRIEYQKVQIHETKVESIQVQVPVIVQEKVPFVVEKEVILHEIIQEPIFEKLIYEKEKPIVTIEEKLIVQEILTEKPIIQRQAVEVPGPETIVRLNDPVEVEVIRQKLVKENQYVEIIKEVVLEQQKIIPLIHERIVSVPINELVTTPQLIEVPKLVNLVHYKEVPVDVPVREERIESRIVQDIVSVDKTVQKLVEVEISRQKIKEVVKEIKSIVKEETIKEIKQEVQILMPTETRIVEVPAETIVQELRSENKTVEIEEKAYQKLVEKIVMLPQIVEIVKNIHHIAEVNQLGVAVDVDVNVQTEKFLGVSTELKKSLVELLGTFRSNVGRQPDLKNLIVIIEKYLKLIDDWIAFPKLIEVEKEVIKEVQKERLVVVPTKDKEKESTLCYILEKLLNELKRIKQAHKIPLNIEEDIQKLFFSERRGDEELDRKFQELQEELRAKYSSFGSWSDSHPFLVSSFLQDHLALQSLIEDANRTQKAQSEEISHLRHELELSSSKYNHILCYNRKMFDDNNSLIKILERYKSSIEGEEFESNLRTHREFYEELIAGKLPVFLSSIQRFSQFADSEVRGEQSESLVSQNEAYVSQLVSKLNRYEAENQSILKKSRALESQITKYSDEISVKNSIIRRLETDFQNKLSRAREELARSPDVSRDILDQNRKLLQKSRILEKEASAEKNNLEKAKRDFERSLESQKRDLTRELERKEREIREASERAKKDYERELRTMSTEMEKLKRAKERLEDQLAELKRRQTEEIKTIRQQQMSGATDKNNQLINENLELRKKSDKIEAEYEQLKKAAVENNTINERETQKLKAEIERLQIEMRNWEKKNKEGFLDLPQETKIINKNIELEKKIKIMESDLSKLREKDTSSNSQLRNLKDKVKNLEIELDVAKREVEASQKMKSTTYQSGYKSGIGSELAVESSLARSPGGHVYKSEERGYISPQSVQSEERIEELGSSSSRFSQESSEERSVYKSQMTLREFMDIKHSEDKDADVYTTYVMIKIIEAIEKEAENGVYHSYSPSNIYLHNFNAKKLDSLVVKFGAHIINKNNRNDGLYLAPEVLGGSVSTKKSVVFCLGVILDELIHGQPFFKSMEEIQNSHIEFKVRGQKLNPILKNTLFEMMNKEPGKRLELVEAKRRLSLQKYITSESRSSVTHQRLSRRREE